MSARTEWMLATETAPDVVAPGEEDLGDDELEPGQLGVWFGNGAQNVVIAGTKEELTDWAQHLLGQLGYR